MKSTLSRLALALPLCAAMAAPAAATGFFNFSFSGTFADTATANGVDIGGRFTVSGQTNDATLTNNSVNVATPPLSFSSTNTNFTSFTPLTGSYIRANNMNATAGTSVNLNFTEVSSPNFNVAFALGNENVFMFRGDTMTNSVFFLFTGTTFYASTLNSTNFRWAPAAQANVVEATSTSRTATLVPEINGSGFAYIAFILGALGLWLYSGGAAGLTRPREEGVAA